MGAVSSLAHYIRIQSIAFEQNPILHLQYIVHTHPMYVRAQHKHRLLWRGRGQTAAGSHECPGLHLSVYPQIQRREHD